MVPGIRPSTRARQSRDLRAEELQELRLFVFLGLTIRATGMAMIWVLLHQESPFDRFPIKSVAIHQPVDLNSSPS